MGDWKVNLAKNLTIQVDSLKGALPWQSWKTEGYHTWAFGPSVLPSALSLQPVYPSSHKKIKGAQLNLLFFQ